MPQGSLLADCDTEEPSLLERPIAAAASQRRSAFNIIERESAEVAGVSKGTIRRKLRLVFSPGIP